MSRQPGDAPPSIEDLELEDYDVARLMQISAVAKEYGITPRQAVREIDCDPEGLAIAILPLRRFQEALEAWKRGDKNELKAWAGNPMFERIQRMEFDQAEEDLGLGEGRR